MANFEDRWSGRVGFSDLQSKQIGCDDRFYNPGCPDFTTTHASRLDFVLINLRNKMERGLPQLTIEQTENETASEIIAKCGDFSKGMKRDQLIAIFADATNDNPVRIKSFCCAVNEELTRKGLPLRLTGKLKDEDTYFASYEFRLTSDSRIVDEVRIAKPRVKLPIPN